MKTVKTDVYKQVTDKIIADLERSELTWPKSAANFQCTLSDLNFNIARSLFQANVGIGSCEPPQPRNKAISATYAKAPIRNDGAFGVQGTPIINTKQYVSIIKLMWEWAQLRLIQSYWWFGCWQLCL
ncbi:hypothetical protein ACFQ3K_12940 [Brucella gallinifaecis]|uniref:hypothetical protein n=1 Tax=Brucella gallinifaecis TaxID=215590 RepID=UPI0018752CC7|nr:hypothetical protein [Brucella gallinifaecis]